MLEPFIVCMSAARSRLSLFLQDDKGTAAVECALIAGVLVLAILTGMAEIGFLTKGYFGNEAMLAATGGR